MGATQSRAQSWGTKSGTKFGHKVRAQRRTKRSFQGMHVASPAKRKFKAIQAMHKTKHAKRQPLGRKQVVEARRAWIASWPRSPQTVRVESLLLLRHGEPHVLGDFGGLVDEDAKDASLPGLLLCGFENMKVFVGALVLVAKHLSTKYSANPVLFCGLLVELARDLESGLKTWEQGVLLLERAFASAPRTALEGGQVWHSSWAKYLFAAMAGTSVAASVVEHGNYAATALIKVTPQNFEAMPYNTVSGFGRVNPELAVQMSRSLYEEQQNSNFGADSDAKPLADTKAFRGKGIVVAVIDGGVDYTHPGLEDNIWKNENEVCDGTKKDYDGNGFAGDCHGWDFVQQSHVVTKSPHGTHVAGIVVANSKSDGVMGMAYDAKIMVLRTLRDKDRKEMFVGDTNVTAQAIRYAVDNQARVINLSLHLNYEDAYTNTALEYAYSKGVVVVAAAGNNGKDEPNYPARHPTCLAVGNALDEKTLTQDSHRAGSNSNFVSAPGTRVLSTWPGGSFQKLTGTSMSSPYVAGVVARMLSANPNMTPNEVMTVLASTSSNSKAAKEAMKHDTSGVPYKLLALAGLVAVKALYKYQKYVKDRDEEHVRRAQASWKPD